MEYTLVRSKRKTLAIHITKQATVEVRAPLRLPAAQIEAFVQSRTGWIEKHLAAARSQKNHRAAFAPGYGSLALYRGKEYPIQAVPQAYPGWNGAAFMLPPGLDSLQIQQAMAAVYKTLAKQLLAERVAVYAVKMGLSPKAVKITSAKTRWGSCSAAGSLNFSWRLVLAGDEAIDYVVVHELAHLRELNHSARFWGLVASTLPDFPQRRKQLKLLQQRLAGEGWGQA